MMFEYVVVANSSVYQGGQWHPTISTSAQKYQLFKPSKKETRESFDLKTYSSTSKQREVHAMQEAPCVCQIPPSSVRIGIGDQNPPSVIVTDGIGK